MSHRAKERFDDVSKLRDVVSESGNFKLAEDTQHIINSRHWEKLTKHLEKGIMLVVRALISRKHERPRQYLLQYEGVGVTFHGKKINEMWECREEDNVEYLVL